jgi:hypothetical protein
MRRPDSFKEQKGFLTIAQNNSETDYLNLAYCQALSIKCTQKQVQSYAVIVDAETKAKLEPKHHEVFDHIIDLPEDDSEDDSWKFKNEWKVWWLTPYKETIKLESDILFTRSIDLWWHGLSQKEVTLTSSVRDYEGEVATSRAYRRLFDDNALPDVYNGLMYFRYGRISRDFFIYARYVFEHWDEFKSRVLKNCRDEEPTTDVVYAIAAEMLGVENCINPALSYPTFTHMKGAIQGWGTSDDWTKKLYTQIDDDLNLTVGFNRQLFPFHYQKKDFMSNDIVAKYEREYHRQHATV